MTMQSLAISLILRGTILFALLPPAELSAQKFYEDDPIQKVPSPMNVEKVLSRKLSQYYDFLHHTLFKPGQRHAKGNLILSRTDFFRH